MSEQSEQQTATATPPPPFLDIYRRPDGGWSFRLGGRESHYYSFHPADASEAVKAAGPPAGLLRTVNAVLTGRPAGTVALKPATAGAKTQGAGKATPPAAAPDSWADLPTLEERVEAFLSRGKLGKKAAETADAK